MNTPTETKPVTEAEMGMVHDILTRAANAITTMSGLEARVNDLANHVQRLTDEQERLRRQNSALEESLDQSRQRRRELETQVSELSNERDSLRSENSREAEVKALMQERIDQLTSRVNTLEQDRDNALTMASEQEGRANDAEAKLKALQDTFAKVFPAPEPKPEPQPEPTPQSTSWGVPAYDTDLPSAQPTPTPAPTPEPEPTIDYNKPYRWDYSEGRHRNVDANGNFI